MRCAWRDARALTFNANHMIAHLLRNLLVRYQVDEIIDGIYGWVHAFESLDLLPYGQRTVEELIIVASARHDFAFCSIRRAAFEILRRFRFFLCVVPTKLFDSANAFRPLKCWPFWLGHGMRFFGAIFP